MDSQEFPSNSRDPKKPEEKKIVTGKVLRRKTPLGKRIAETFVPGEAKGVGSYILFDVIVPAFKDVIADVVSQGIEKMLFGEARSSSRRTGQRPSGSSGYVSYNRYSSSPWKANQSTSRPTEPPARRRQNHDFDEFVLATRAEAEEVIDRLFDLVSKYEQATVLDLYELLGVASDFTAEKYGWTDLRGAGVTRISGGYLLDLPKPEVLD